MTTKEVKFEYFRYPQKELQRTTISNFEFKNIYIPRVQVGDVVFNLTTTDKIIQTFGCDEERENFDRNFAQAISNIFKERHTLKLGSLVIPAGHEDNNFLPFILEEILPENGSFMFRYVCYTYVNGIKVQAAFKEVVPYKPFRHMTTYNADARAYHEMWIMDEGLPFQYQAKD